MRSEEFVTSVVHYFNENQSTVRKTAEHFKISKSSVYYYLTKVKPNPWSEQILLYNKSQRHIRGGLATRNKYLSMRS